MTPEKQLSQAREGSGRIWCTALRLRDCEDDLTKIANTPIPRFVLPTDRRENPRCKFNQLMRIRPSSPEREHFEDITVSTNVSRNGAYFQTNEEGYERGMRLFVTMPYSDVPSVVNCEYLAEVMHIEPLPDGRLGVGIKLLMGVGLRHADRSIPPSPEKWPGAA